MIFVTVGTQGPFERMVAAVDAWAGARGRTDVFAQVGGGARRPRHIDCVESLTPAEFRSKIEQARVVVAHAGMGTILHALELGKPIVVLPRRAELGEQRNDHQLATVERLSARGLVTAAADETELAARLDELDALAAAPVIEAAARPELLARVRAFLGQAAGSAESFDGVVCFGGEDWWYHNRGHFDMQVMRELSRSMPVLYVNSIGMRMPGPGEGRMFVKRMRRKLRSLSRGLVKVRENFGVYSPFVVPGALGMKLSGGLLPLQVRLAARRMGIKRPLAWVACPPAFHALEGLRPVGVVYQRTDRFEAFAGVDTRRIAAFDRALKKRAELVVFCSRHLWEAERTSCRRSAFVDHGVDFEVFARAGRRVGGEPRAFGSIPRPRVGFVGGIDAHTFDPALFVDVARRMPDVRFVLVGASSLPTGWCTLSNVHLLGRVPYDEVADYMAASDVLVMPWNKSEWIQACNPVKLKEYLAVGRPVVSTSFPEAQHYAGRVQVADGADDFMRAVRRALADPGDAEARRVSVAEESWDSRAQRVLAELEEAGIVAASRATKIRARTRSTPPPRSHRAAS